MVGGDQHCVSLASSVKKSLRRAGKLGKNAARFQGSHIDPLGLEYLSQHPGLNHVAKAFKAHQVVPSRTPHGSMQTEGQRGKTKATEDWRTAIPMLIMIAMERKLLERYYSPTNPPNSLS